MLAGKEGVVEAELGQIPNAARIQDPIEVVYLVLHDPSMKVPHGTIDGHTGSIKARIAQMPIPRHQPADPRHRQASFPALLLLLAQRRQGWVDQHRKGYGIGLRVARILLEAEYHHAQAHADLRCSEAGSVEIAHRVPHVDEQAFEFGSAEFEYRQSHRQQARIAHFENFAYCHGSEYLSDLFHGS